MTSISNVKINIMKIIFKIINNTVNLSNQCYFKKNPQIYKSKFIYNPKR